MKGKTTAIAALLGIAATGLAVTAIVALRPGEAAGPLLDPAEAETVARGQVLYRSECAACHGPLEPGATAASAPTAPPHDASGHSWQHPDFALFEMTKSGEVAALCRSLEGTDMPQFAEALSDRQIVDVLTYIKSTWPAGIRAEQAATNSLYAAQNAAVRAVLEASGAR